MGKHRPWIVPIPPTTIDALGETITIVVNAPRATRSFRKLTLLATEPSLVVVDRVCVGSLETGREILGGTFPLEIFGLDQPETFDAPIESGQGIAIVLRDLRRSWPLGIDFAVRGVLLGKGPPR